MVVAAQVLHQVLDLEERLAGVAAGARLARLATPAAEGEGCRQVEERRVAEDRPVPHERPDRHCLGLAPRVRAQVVSQVHSADVLLQVVLPDSDLQENVLIRIIIQG